MADHTASSLQETAELPAIKRTPLPDLSDIIFVLVVVMLVFMLPNFVLNDGSTGWHLMTGHYILDHRAIPQSDLFSYTFPNKPWVPYEWLFDAVAAGLEKLGGLKLVAVSASCAIALLFSKLYLECRKSGCHFGIAVILTILGVIVSSIHWLARPHLFTWFGVLIFSTHLERFRQGDESARRFILTLALTMIVWANAHPAFLVGLVLICFYFVGEVVSALVNGEPDDKKACWARAKVFSFSLLCCVIASEINPNAAHLYRYIFDYLHKSTVLATTNEFMAPDLHQLHAVFMLLIGALFVAGLAVSRTRLALAPLMSVLAFAWLGLTGMRNEPLFVIIAVPLTASLFANADYGQLFQGHRFTPSPLAQKIYEKWKGLGRTVDEVEFQCDMHIVPIAFTALLFVACLFGGKIAGTPVVTSDWDPKTKPTATIEYIRTNHLPMNAGFSLDNWGGYLAYKTGERVFIDDRLDFYGEPFFMNYGDILTLKPNWKDLLNQQKIQWVLFPKKAPLTLALEHDPDWKLSCEDQVAALIVRRK